MIYYSIPYSTNKNIGAYYNSVMENLPNDTDFACFVDGDTIFTTPNFGDQILDVVSKYPECGFFTCYTNRVGYAPQVYPFVDKDNNDIDYHRTVGKSLQQEYWDKCEPISSNSESGLLSGVMMLIRKDLWKELGGFKDGMLSVDNDFHRKCIDAGKPVYLMIGVYIYHWYRWPNYGNVSHLKSVGVKDVVNHSNYKKNKKVVYTCIFGQYDTLRDPQYVNPEWDYVCFTDQYFPTKVWKLRQIPKDCLEEEKKKIQRKMKILPNRYLSEYELSIWIDGNLELLVDPQKLVNENEHKFLTTISHPERICLYDELDACERLKKDTHQKMDEIRKFLLKEKYPKNNGLAQTNVMIRNHKDDGVSSLCEHWWSYLKKYSHRDQTVFNYVLWKFPNLAKKVNIFSARSLFTDFGFYSHGTKETSVKKKDPGIRYGYLNNYVNGVLIFDGDILLRSHLKDRVITR